jgi:hypothetical protein
MSSGSRSVGPKWAKGPTKFYSSIQDPLGIFSGTNNYQKIGIAGEGGIMGLGDMFGITNPAEPTPTPTVPTTPTPAAQATAAEEAAAKARREFLAKQALLSSKNSTIKTTSLGQASDTLQTGKKTLLGGV